MLGDLIADRPCDNQVKGLFVLLAPAGNIPLFPCIQDLSPATVFKLPSLGRYRFPLALLRTLIECGKPGS
jgi:hypothetical protein